MINVIVSQNPGSCDHALVPGKNLFTDSRQIRSLYGSITSLEEDLLNLSAGIYATDLAVRRLQAEQYARDIQIHVDVVNLHAFQRVKGDIEEALFLLSGDNWALEFNQKDKKQKLDATKPTTKQGIVLLFSGGLDSFCAASKLLTNGTPLVLVSHVTHNRPATTAQEVLHQDLENWYHRKLKRLGFRIYGRTLQDYPFPKDPNREPSQRTRSFLFLALASLAANREGFSKILYMAENGQFAIHLPLTSARVGPFSTHTADPEFLAKMQTILRTLFSCDQLRIINPYQYKTKSEVLDDLNQHLISKIPHSISCWAGARLHSVTHCGRCIPCLARRIALEGKGIRIAEYERDIFNENLDTLPHHDEGKRNLVDLMQLVKQFLNYSESTKHSLIIEYPELVNEYFDQDKAISMYIRFAKEAQKVFSRYPKVRAIMK
jgi:7-cyano-7-deazaguanine synthase in queuosine biosynthesis